MDVAATHSGNLGGPPRIIRQSLEADCGVAALAMAAGCSYTTAMIVFEAAGLHQPKRKGRKPYSSNFKELLTAVRLLGRDASMIRFQGWHQVTGPCVMKVRNGHKYKWHWVYAGRDDKYGLHVLDPNRSDHYLERMPFGCSGVTLSYFEPFGCFLQFDSFTPCPSAKTAIAP